MRILILALLVASPVVADTLEIVRQIPHSGYSEGIDYHEGFIWNAFPKEILKIDPKDGTVVARYLPASAYSESLKWVGNKIWNVSYSDNGIYEGTLVGGELKFTRRGNSPEEHAWGLEFDGKSLVMTGNYSNKLYFLDPKTLAVTKTLVTTLKDIEDLAWDGSGFWASSYTENRGSIVRIDPKTGKVSRLFTLPNPEVCPIIDGLAWDGKYLWLTGKHCPGIYQLKRPSDRAISSSEVTKK